ncbi:MAG: hypothetical protein JNM51_03905 [Bacteroidia bacterium]|nr:hypothetical protein [Bacteroidia bacterium]
MKTILFHTIALLSIILVSCNKDYSCKCTTTLSQEGYYPKKTETIEGLKKNTSKKKAIHICKNTQAQMQANTRLLFPDYIDVATKCELKDY